MSDTTILRQHDQATADFIDRWRAKYRRNYDFSKTEDQPDFYEGMLEMARHIATHNSGAGVLCSASTRGVDLLSVGVVPWPEQAPVPEHSIVAESQAVS